MIPTVNGSNCAYVCQGCGRCHLIPHSNSHTLSSEAFLPTLRFVEAGILSPRQPVSMTTATLCSSRLSASPSIIRSTPKMAAMPPSLSKIKTKTGRHHSRHETFIAPPPPAPSNHWNLLEAEMASWVREIGLIKRWMEAVILCAPRQP